MRRRRRHIPHGASPAPAAATADPEQAWHLLGVVIDWVKHAETKAAATLTAAGVIGGVVYNLVDNLPDPGLTVRVGAATCAGFTLAGGLAAAWSIRPRLWSRGKPSSLLYYHHIAKAHPRRGGPASFIQTLRDLSADPQRLTDEIAGQVWANAHVASTKYRWANVGLAGVLVGLLALAATSLAVAAGGT